MTDTTDIAALVERLRLLGYDGDERYMAAALIEAQAETITRQAAQIQALQGLLALMYDKWEDGDACFIDPEDCSGYLGQALKLSDEEEARIIAAIDSAQAASQPGIAAEGDEQ